MTAAFWLLGALGFVGWAYVGYPMVCLLRAKLLRRPMKPDLAYRPRVSIVIAAFREAKTIARKLEGLAEQTYPQELVEVIVACDGSDDGTPEIAREAAAKALEGRAQVIVLAERSGKPSALNAAVERASGEVLILTDARQPLSKEAVQALVEDLGDPDVGAVGGELVLGGGAPAGAYWKYEAALRKWEAASGSTVGVSGALYAIHRALWQPLPDGTILDDVLQPMRVRLAKQRVGFERRAQAFDTAAESKREFQRKVRTLSGNFQLLLLEPRLLLPFVNPSFFDFFSHKLCRLVVPWAMMVALVAALLLPWPYSLVLGGGQLGGYALALLSLAGVRLPLGGLAETFVVLNAAAVVGLFRFVRHGRALPWT